MKKIVALGEVLMRLSPEKGLCLGNNGTVRTYFGGSEANVLASLSKFGYSTAMVSLFADNAIGEAARQTLRAWGVDIGFSGIRGGRQGMYLYESGYTPTAGKCTYDRADSVFALAKPEDFDWDIIFKDAQWFHFSGITPALGGYLPQICEEACKKAQEKGLIISIDVNYRSKLWSKAEAISVMGRLCQYASVLFMNEEEASILGLSISKERLLEKLDYREMLAHAMKKFPDLDIITSAARTEKKDGKPAIGAIVADRYGHCFTSTYHQTYCEDPVGAGDAYAAALIATLLKEDQDKPEAHGEFLANAIEIAAVACAVSHSVCGDFNTFSYEDIVRFAHADGKAIHR